jgi:hypothetical protein
MINEVGVGKISHYYRLLKGESFEVGSPQGRRILIEILHEVVVTLLALLV